MFRLLVVEDEEATLEELAAFLREEFGDSVVDTAKTAEEGIQLIKRSAEGYPYDVVVLDFMLPTREGYGAEINESLCQEIKANKATMPETVVLHITAWPDDPHVKVHSRAYHIEPQDVRAAFISKLDVDWPGQAAAKIKSLLFGAKIEKELGYLFQDHSTSAGIARGRVSSDRPRGDRSHTHALARLSRNIVEYWPYLSETVRGKVRQHFHVDENHAPVQVHLRMNGEEPIGGDHETR
jgi:CheY-like chemotaxis protein